MIDGRGSKRYGMNMTWARFHHPDISLPVIRRRIGIEIIELMKWSALYLTRGGWAVANQSTYPNRTAYRNATLRLREKGLLVYQKGGGHTPQLMLSSEGEHAIPAYFTPERFWDQRWNGLWYMLVYDVPEVDRKYRDVLRCFLKRMRMGCLQQSVWVTPQDIRPQFDDLCKSANVDTFSFLFEARTLLGLSSLEIVEGAWDFDRLRELQDHFCRVCELNIARLDAETQSMERLGELIRISLEAYHAAFIEDPLLPAKLLPHGYAGRDAYQLHKQLMQRIDEQLYRNEF